MIQLSHLSFISGANNKESYLYFPMFPPTRHRQRDMHIRRPGVVQEGQQAAPPRHPHAAARAAGGLARDAGDARAHLPRGGAAAAERARRRPHHGGLRAHRAHCHAGQSLHYSYICKRISSTVSCHHLYSHPRYWNFSEGVTASAPLYLATILVSF